MDYGGNRNNTGVLSKKTDLKFLMWVKLKKKNLIEVLNKFTLGLLFVKIII